MTQTNTPQDGGDELKTLEDKMRKCFDNFGHDVVNFGSTEGARHSLSRKYVKYLLQEMGPYCQTREREAVDGMHNSIMRHELVLGTEADTAFNYARIHRWIDNVKDQLNHHGSYPKPQAGDGEGA